MPRGGARVGAGRPRKNPGKGTPGSDPVADGVVPAPVGDEEESIARQALTPLDYMLKVMNNHKAEPRRRDQMAVAAAPYVHQKKGEGGKKDGRLEKAGEAGKGRFAATPTPLALVGRK